MLFHIRNLLKTRKREAAYRLLIKKLDISEGAKIALLGPSGCGKSTTLDLLGLALAPDYADKFTFSPGQAFNIPELWQQGRLNRLTSLRRDYMGYVLQSGELLPCLSTGENICLTASLAGLSKEEILTTAHDLAKQLGIDRLWNARPDTLSVGERQRAAIARALAAKPRVILADEPTAALDPLHADKVMDIFLRCIKEFGSALILVTHNEQWAMDGGLTPVRFRLEEDKNGVAAIIDSGDGT